MHLNFYKQLRRRSGGIGAIVILALTIVNGYFYIALYRSHCRELNKVYAETQEPEQLAVRFFPDRPGRWDNSRQYQLLDNFIVGGNFVNLSKKSRVTLASHSDADHFHHIFEIIKSGKARETSFIDATVQSAPKVTPTAMGYTIRRWMSLLQPSVAVHWSGPISLALFVGGVDEWLVLKAQLSFLLECHRKIAANITFHLVMPKILLNGTRDSDEFEQSLADLLDGMDCQIAGKAFQMVVNLWKPNKLVKRFKPKMYPQNHLRNLARKNSQTSHVFLTDVDIIPCLNFHEHIENFLARETLDSNAPKRKIAYVVPTYEIQRKTSFPKSKNEVVRLARRGLARPYHKKVFFLNQWSTNFRKYPAEKEVWRATTSWRKTNNKQLTCLWQKKKDSNEEFRVAHNVSEYFFGYEPFYVAQDNAPPYDERFLGYGYTRNTQVLEMVVSGYTFSVLSPAFAVHWGYQRKESRPRWRLAQVERNNGLKTAFDAEVAARYNVTDLAKFVYVRQKHSMLIRW